MKSACCFLRIMFGMLVFIGINVYYEADYKFSALNPDTVCAAGGSYLSSASFVTNMLSAASEPHAASDRADDKIVFTDGKEYFEYSLEELKLVRYQDYDRDSIFYDYTRCTDPGTLSYQLFRLAEKVNRAPANAEFYLDEEDNLQIQSEKAGQTVDLSQLITSLGNPGLYWPVYQLPLKIIEPQVTAADLEGRRPSVLWSEYTTKLVNNPERTENIRLAAACLQGVVVKPGEVISFNRLVGPRTAEYGYREAKVIVAERFEDGLGGGVCQVSSTLYNVLLLAGLQIQERHNHSVRVSYVPLGRDAAIVYGYKDLIFKNQTESTLLILAKLNGLNLQISIYGSSPSVYESVYLVNRIIKTYPSPTVIWSDAAIKSGEKIIKQTGQKGYLAETSRVFVTADKKVQKELLSRDYYAARETVVAVNPADTGSKGR